VSTTRATQYRRSAPDHFEPETTQDPHAQRKLRGQLEQIDYTAFAANREVIGRVIGHADVAKFQHIAVAAASARAQWVSEALTAGATASALTADQVARLAHLRAAYEELTEVYEAMRRMVERGYLTYRSPLG
jgi:hypothetical protein